jgi:hypothetical protein
VEIDSSSIRADQPAPQGKIEVEAIANYLKKKKEKRKKNK